MSREDILICLKKLKNDNELKGQRLGLAGSYARGTNNQNSDIDIIVDSDGVSLKCMEYIKQYFHGFNVDVLCLGLLKKEDSELDNFLKEMDLPVNDDSVYKTILREVIWCE